MRRPALVTLVALVALLPSAQPRQQHRRQQQPDAESEVVSPAQEAWSAALTEFDATSGEHMHQANLDVGEGRIAEACVTYEYLHRGLRGNPILLDRSEADVVAERAALAVPVRLKRDAVRELLSQKAALEKQAALAAGRKGESHREYKLEVSPEQHALFGSPSESAALKEILSNTSRAWWSGFCDYCHPSHIGQLGNRHVASPLKLRHDAQQLAFLLTQGKLPDYLWPVVTSFLLVRFSIFH